MTQAREARQTGTSAPVNRATSMQARIVDGETVGLRQQPQRRGGIGRTAADAGRDRQHLVERETADLQTRHAFAEQPRRLEHEIVGGLATGLRQRPVTVKLQFRSGLQAQTVGAIGKRHHAFELMIAVNAPSNHPKRQVDLGTPVSPAQRGGFAFA